MNIEGIRSLKQHLQEQMDYAPPDDAPDHMWDNAVLQAEKARARYDRMSDTFALLDAIDKLNARVKKIEKLLAHEPEQWDGDPLCPSCGYETDDGHCIVCHPRDDIEKRISKQTREANP